MAGSNSSASAPPPPPRHSLFCVRFSILILLAVFSAASVYFFSTLTVLQDKIRTDESTISSLQQSINGQQLIINRFNQSVTNADVQKKVAALEQSLHETENQMLSSLDKTTIQIQTLLNATVASLDSTVKEAQADIQHEVAIVKGDVEQYVRTTQDQFSMENSFMVWQLAGTFTVLACLISMWHMTAHVRKFKRPFVQRKILAILWMSPIYGITSWLSLVFPVYEGYLAIFKDLYEAYVVYQFLSFLISVLGKGNRDNVVNVLAKHANHLEPPMRLCGCFRGKYPDDDPRSFADAVLMQCQIFTMQFVFFKPMTAIGLFTCIKLGITGDGPFDYRNFPFWFKIIQNLSVFMAFSGLLKFYHAVQTDLGWCRPFPKFLCIKGIVFMTFWQSMVISFLANSTNMAGGKSDKDSDPDIWGKQAQNFLICLEMLLFSIAHFYCFPTDEWEDGYRPAIEKKMSAGDNLALGDFMNDLKLIIRGSDIVVDKKKKKKMKASMVPDGTGANKEYHDPEQGIKVGGTTVESTDANLIASPHGSVSSDISYGSHRNDVDIDDDTSFGDSDLDSSLLSFDGDFLSASLKSSLNRAVINPNEDVRDAANRLLPFMDQIGEEDESNVSNAQGEDDTYGSVSSTNNQSVDQEPTESATVDDNVNGCEESDEAADETTSLLGSSAKNTVQLRPSIFTDLNSPK